MPHNECGADHKDEPGALLRRNGLAGYIGADLASVYS
jgi:hypothetical protein